jgi:hypothetical protein
VGGNKMAHFAKVVDGIVQQVIVADNKEWCETNLGGTWIQTSYNTIGGVNNRLGGESLHKNYAGVGYTFDGVGFAAPQPYPSWTKNSETYLWNPPTPYPTDGKFYYWSEDDLTWREVTND